MGNHTRPEPGLCPPSLRGWRVAVRDDRTGLNGPLALSLGPTDVKVQALDMAGAIYKKNFDINVLKVAISSRSRTQL
jgi:hypothetical protein